MEAEYYPQREMEETDIGAAEAAEAEEQEIRIQRETVDLVERDTWLSLP